MTGWSSSASTALINWRPLTSIISSVDSESINFLVVASEFHPIFAVSDSHTFKITDSQFTIP
jgi:hypothetical protein